MDKGHGRIETRSIWLSDKLADYLTFPHASVVFRIERVRTKLDGTSPTREITYGLTDLPGTGTRAAAKLLDLVRGHWGIEKGVATLARPGSAVQCTSYDDEGVKKGAPTTEILE